MRSTAAYAPKRGDVVWITLDPQAGHEQGGRRPALALSPTAYNRQVGLALLCPITGQAKGYPFEVALPEGLRMTGVALADHVKSLDWRARKTAFICAVPEEFVSRVLRRLHRLLVEVPDSTS